MPITKINVVNLGKMLKRAGFEHFVRNGKRLFTVIELTFDEVKSIQQGISSYEIGADEPVDKQYESADEEPGKEKENLQISLPF